MLCICKSVHLQNLVECLELSKHAVGRARPRELYTYIHIISITDYTYCHLVKPEVC